MSDYFNKTEEQEFNDIKAWLKENGTPIVSAIVAVLLAVSGWNFWKNHQLESAQQTSASYQQVMESYLQNPTKNAPLVEKFVADNSNSVYAAFANLESAKQAVEQGDFVAAKVQLQQALANNDDASLQNVVRFRLAAIDLQLKNYDEALSALANIKDSAWTHRKQVLSGDILAAKGDIDAARSAYQQAKESASAQEKQLIDLRLNQL